MKNKKKIIIANWKMNGRLAQSIKFIKELRENMLKYPVNPETEIVICPPLTLLRDIAEKLPRTLVKLGAQNCHHEIEGAYTGETSAIMLRDMTCDYVILGHSERRIQQNESSETVQKKAKTAIEAKLISIICVGETLYERDNDLTKIIIREQVINSIPSNANETNLIIAYEPVWAIGSGKTPTNPQIQEVHHYIREIINSEFPHLHKDIKVIYGGSTNYDNSAILLSIKGVDGLLVGKASLDIKQFWKMIESAN